jgi:hypothetical protein
VRSPSTLSTTTTASFNPVPPSIAEEAIPATDVHENVTQSSLNDSSEHYESWVYSIIAISCVSGRYLVL